MLSKFIVLVLIFIPLLFLTPPRVMAVTTIVDLLTADSFAVLAGDEVTNVPVSTIIGNVGLSPASGSFYAGLTCAEVTGTIYSVDASGPLPCRVTNPGLLTQAKSDLTTAYTDAAGRTPVTTIGTELAGATLTDGVYDSGSGDFEIASAGTLTLNGQGDPNSVFIFNMADQLTTFATSNVSLINGAQACNVFWRVGSSAILGTGTNFVGTIMADQSITDNGGSTISGRFLARIADVVLNNTTITRPTCAAPGSGPGPSSTSPSSSGPDGPSSMSCPALSSQIIPPTVVASNRVDSDSIFISWSPYSGTNTFIVQYGPTNGNWLYSTNVTGFSTTLNNLPAGRPIWVRVAARNDCFIGTYGPAARVGGAGGGVGSLGFPNTGGSPLLPNAGFGPPIPQIIYILFGGGLLISLAMLYRSKKTS